MLLPVLALSLALGAKDPAVDRTEKFIAKLVEVKPDDGKLTAKDKEANQKIFSELDGYFDFDALTAAPIMPRLDKFSADQKAEFYKKFKELIRLIAYPDSGSFFKKAKYTVGDAKPQGDVVTVPIDAKVV